MYLLYCCTYLVMYLIIFNAHTHEIMELKVTIFAITK